MVNRTKETYVVSRQIGHECTKERIVNTLNRRYEGNLGWSHKERARGISRWRKREIGRKVEVQGIAL